MKMTMKVLSAMLTVVMIFGIITSAPVTAFAKEAEEQPVAVSEESTDAQSEEPTGLNEETENSTNAAVTDAETVVEESVAEQTTELSDKDDEAVGATSGTTGDCTWSLSDDGVLTVSGQGKMADYYSPWGKNITSLIVESGVTKIGSEAFYKCSKLTSVILPQSLQSIDSNAFYYCSSLNSIDIPGSVTEIKSNAFRSCTKLTSVILPKSLQIIDSGVFSYCDNLNSIDIPDSVTEIKSSAFSNCIGLENVVIPNSVNKIGSQVFFSCTALQKIKLPDSITGIPNQAFKSCVNLTDVELPENLSTIDNSAFYGCKGIKNISIPKSVISIGEQAFRECTSLLSINIPDGIKTLNFATFYNCSSLTSVHLPDSITTIGNSTFFNCSALTECHLPRSVTSIGEYVMSGCKGITELQIPRGITKISKDAFSGCSVTSVVIPDGVTEIGEYAFAGCVELTDVAIPDSVTKINPFAFSRCQNLKSIELPDDIKTISKDSFAYCSSLTEVTIPNGVTLIDEEAFRDCTALKKVSIPDSVTQISTRAFNNCKKLTDITIPNSVSALGTYVFYSCTSLRKIVIPNSLKKIPDYTFEKCSSLISVTISNSVTTMENNVFYDCTSLSDVTIPNSVTSIGNSCFYECKSLKSIIIPDSVRTLGNSAFLKCTSLKEVRLSNRLKTLSSAVFYGCTALKNLVVPPCVTKIEKRFCYNCTSLRTITIPDTAGSIGTEAFYNCKNFTLRCVPGSYVEQYAVKNKYKYEYSHEVFDGTIQISAHEDLEGLTVSVADVSNRTTSREIKNGNCLFSGLNPNMEYTVFLTNKNGRVIKQKTVELLENKNTHVDFDTDNLYTSNVELMTEDGSVVSDYSVEWFVNGAAAADSTAATAKFLNIGDKVTCRVKLGDSLKRVYQNPESITREMTAADETFAFTAKRAETKNVTVKVENEKGEPVPSASVSIVQQIDSKKNNADNYITDENGILNVSLRVTETTIKATDASFYSVNWNGVPDGSDIIITLKSAVGAAFIPNVTYRYIDNTIRANVTEPNLNSLAFTVFNVTKGTFVSNYNYNNNRLIIPFEEITKGDKLEISVTDTDRIFADTKSSVTYNKDAEYFDLNLVEKGKILVDYTSANEDNLAMIFNAGGAREDLVVLSNSSLSSGLSAGSYTVVVMEYSELVFNTPNLTYLDYYGLEENKHYKKFEVTVNDGEVSLTENVVIPAFDESEMTIVDSKASYISLSSIDIPLKKYVDLTVNYEILEKKKYEFDVKGVKIVVPEGADFDSTKIKLDGEAIENTTFEGNTITVPATGQRGNIALSLRWNDFFSTPNPVISAYLMLEKDGESYINPIDMVYVSTDLRFSVPSVVSSTVIPITGYTGFLAMVDVFVDGVLQTTVKSTEIGGFSITINLDDTTKHSFHEIYFETVVNEKTYRSKKYLVEYNDKAVCLDAVYISPNGVKGNSVKIYSADGGFSNSYYVYPGKMDTLTFKADFTGDVSKLKKVALCTTSNSGQTVYIPLLRIGNTNSFTGSHTYNDDFPESFDVIYDYEPENALDWGATKQKQAEYQENVDKANNLLEEWKQSYNALSDEEKAEFDKAGIPDLQDAEDAYDVFRKADGGIVMQDENDSFSFRTEEWDDESKTESDLLSEGYIKVKTENQNNKVYVLYGQNSCITADLSTHHFTALYFDDDESKSGEKIGGWGESAAEEALSIVLGRLKVKYESVQKLAELQESTAEAWMRIYQDNTDLLARLEAQGGSFSEMAQKAAREAERAKKLATSFEILGRLLNEVMVIVDVVELANDVDYYMKMVGELEAMRDQYRYLLSEASRAKKCSVSGFPELAKALNDFDNRLGSFKLVLAAVMSNIIVQLASLLSGPAGLVTELIVAATGIIVDALQEISKTEVEEAYNLARSLIGSIEDMLISCGKNIERYQFPGKRRKKIDPSGYVYEAVPGNKLSGVTVTAFYSANPDGSGAEIWDAEEFDQENPLLTDSMGHYEWFVPEGYWQVRCEKDGYLTAYSDWLPVPPPQTDVNIPMVSLEAPKLLYANAYSDSVEFEFSQYMNPDSFNHQTVKVTMDEQEVDGDIIPLNLESSPNGKYYTKRFAFIPEDGVQLNGTVKASVKSVQNYAGSVIDDEYQNSLVVSERVTEIACEESLNFKYGETAEAVVQFNPAEAAAGRTVTVKVDNTSVLEAKSDKVTVDNNGKAVVGFNLLLPGEAKVKYTLDGTGLTAQSTATIFMSKGQLPRVTASIESGAKVTKGTKLELFCENADAKIYYTLDLSCPCQENNPDRILYTGPITLNEDTQLIAYAILDGYEDSKTRLFTYTVSNRAIGDVTGDNTVDILDAVRVQKYTVEKVAFTDEQKDCADVNDDGVIDILDTTMIQKFAVDRITSFKKKG